MNSKAVLVALAIMAAAGANPAHSAMTDKLAGIHRVAILSALGDAVVIQKIGFTAFGNRKSLLQIPDWGLDSFVISQVSAAIDGRFQVVSIPYDKTRFLTDHADEAPSDETVAAGIRTLPPSDVDAYIVVHPRYEPLPYPSNQGLEGLGAGIQGSLLIKLAPYLFAVYEIDVYRANSGTLLMRRSSGLTRSHGLNAPAYPTVPEDRADWADSAELMTDTQKDHLRTNLENLLTKTLAPTLAGMGLTP